MKCLECKVNEARTEPSGIQRLYCPTCEAKLFPKPKEKKPMAMKFKLEIRLGNDSTQTLADVANQLLATAAKVQHYNDRIGTSPTRAKMSIQDVNGNFIGWWELTKPRV